jgi:hypothetical protein
MKRASTIILIFAMLVSLGAISTSANTAIKENPPDASIDWANVNSISLTLSFSGTTANCSGRISGRSDVNSILATFTLRRVNSDGTTTFLRNWASSSNTSSLNFSASHSPVTKGETYRLEVSAVVTTTSGGREMVWDSVERTY